MMEWRQTMPTPSTSLLGQSQTQRLVGAGDNCKHCGLFPKSQCPGLKADGEGKLSECHILIDGYHSYASIRLNPLLKREVIA